MNSIQHMYGKVGSGLWLVPFYCFSKRCVVASVYCHCTRLKKASANVGYLRYQPGFSNFVFSETLKLFNSFLLKKFQKKNISSVQSYGNLKPRQQSWRLTISEYHSNYTNQHRPVLSEWARFFKPCYNFFIEDNFFIEYNIRSFDNYADYQ